MAAAETAVLATAFYFYMDHYIKSCRSLLHFVLVISVVSCFMTVYVLHQFRILPRILESSKFMKRSTVFVELVSEIIRKITRSGLL